jgi:hypothetical protein
MAAGGVQSAAAAAVLAQLADPRQLEALILQLTVADTQQIAQAEAIIKKYLKGPVCIGGLMQQVGNLGLPPILPLFPRHLRPLNPFLQECPFNLQSSSLPSHPRRCKARSTRR